MTQIEAESYTIAEAAALTGLHRNTIRLRVKMGQLPAQRAMGKFGEEYRISRQTLIDAGLLAPPEPPPGPAPDPAGSAAASPSQPQETPTVYPSSPAPPLAADTPSMPSQQALSDLFQRHEHAMFRLGFMEAELARHKALAENAESLRSAAREREQEVQNLRRDLALAQDRAREIDELRLVVREMEQETERMREEVERHRAAASRRWWHVFFGKRHPQDVR